MNDSNPNIKTGKKEIKGILSKDGKTKYDIKITEEKVEFDKLEKDKGIGKVKADITKYEKEGDNFKKDGVKEEGKDIELVFKGGTFWYSAEIKKIGDQEVETGKTVGGPFRWPLYVTVVAIVVVLAALVAWWVMASRKEDKEEGDL